MKPNVMEVLTYGENAVLFRLKAVVKMMRAMARKNRYPAALRHMRRIARKNITGNQLYGTKTMFSLSNYTDSYKWISKHA
jgi:hypothetical protein